MIRNIDDFFCRYGIDDNLLKYLFEKLVVLRNPDLEWKTKRELRVLELKLCYFRTFKEVGEHMGVSLERTRQIFKRALSRIKSERK